ncbi:MAG: DUF11 domain-containing protein [Deltaproteobacteria bacterium]|nr:DUF11 domain-containing protein [Deltaproteobacteria bacterium]
MSSLVLFLLILTFPQLIVAQEEVPPELRTDLLRIVSPADGAVVAPGQTITVVVEVAPGSPFTHIGVIGENIGFSEPKTTPPFDFSLTIPNNLIGQKMLTAVGIISPGDGLFSQSVTVNIETAATLKDLKISLRQIDFRFAGAQSALNVTGIFADGTSLNITKSAGTTYSSENDAVAIVDPTGLVTAVGAGTTNIIVAYGSQAVAVPVSVPKTIQGDFDANRRVDRDDLNILLDFLGLLVTDDWTNIPDSLKRPAVIPSDARDLNGDGVVDAQDVRILAGLIGALADLSITNIASSLAVPLGRSVTYTISVVNNGPDPAPHVMVSDILSGVRFVSSSATQGTGCSEAAGYVTCHLETLKRKAKARVTIEAVPTQTGDILNVASVNSGVPDPTVANDTAMVTVKVSADPGGDVPGRMTGKGNIDANGKRHVFNFSVEERTSGKELGRLELQVRDLQAGGAVLDRFASTSITGLLFSDAPGITPGPRPPPSVDTVEFSGTGRWNGRSGFTFEARGTDAGEPGRGRDSFAITVRDEAGSIVASVSGNLSGGNIQSLKVRR